MVANDGGGTVPRRQLGRELRQLREDSGVPIAAICDRMEWGRQKIWRIERGETTIRVVDVESLCEIFGASPRTVEALTALVHESRETRGWYHSYGDVIPEWFEVYVGLEGAATSLSEYDAELVYGPLQTKDYARAVLRIGNNGGDVEIDRKVELRLGRQARLTDNGLHLDLIMNEAVLRRPVGGPTVMAEQLRQLLTFSDLDNVSIRVLPYSVGAHGGMLGSFAILAFPENGEPVTVYVEELTGALYLTKPKEVSPYRQHFDNMSQVAASRAESRDLIRSAMEEFNHA